MEKRAGMGKLIKAKSRILLENRRTRESLEKIRIYFISLSILLFSSLPPSRETIFYDSRRLLSRPVPAASTFFPSARDLEELRYLFRAFSDPRTVVKKYQTIERISGIPNRGLRSLQFKKTLCISIHPFQVITISFLFLPTNDIIIREFIRVYFILFYRR